MSKTKAKPKEYPYGYICLSCGAVWPVYAWAEKNLRDGTDLNCCFICAGEVITIAEKPYIDPLPIKNPKLYGDEFDTYRPREF